jgi:hypothetical protein
LGEVAVMWNPSYWMMPAVLRRGLVRAVPPKETC